MFSDTLYFLTIIVVWKVLGAIAILVPGFARLKEWTYAGIFFNVTGAAASHWAVGDYGVYAFHVLVNLFVAALVVASWALRPQSRTLGVFFPAKTREPSREQSTNLSISRQPRRGDLPCYA